MTNLATPKADAKNRGARPARHASLDGWILLLPALLLLAAVFYFPVIKLLATSFGLEEFTLKYYQKIVDNPTYFTVLLRTVRISFLVTVGCAVLGYPVAWLLARSRGAKATLLTIFVLLPLWTSLLVRTYAWTVLLQRNGLLNTALQWVGITSEPVQMLYTEGAVVAAMVHVLLPFFIVPVWASLRLIPRDYARAARVLGASGVRILFRITLPLSRSGVWAGCQFVFLLSIGFFVTPALVGGPRQTMIGTLISQQALDSMDWPFASALSAVIVAAVFLFLPVIQKLFSLDRNNGGSP